MTADDWNKVSPATDISTAYLDNLVKQMQEQYAEYEAAKKHAAGLLETYNETEAKVLETLRLAGKKKYFVEGLGTVSIRTKFQVTTPKSLEAKQAFFKFLAEKGEAVYYGILSVNSQTLNSFYNAELKAAQEVGAGNFSIPGIDEPTHRDTIAFTKERGIKNDDQASNS